MLISPPEPIEAAEATPSTVDHDACAAPAPAPASDGQLLLAYLADRDDAAFAQLVTRFGPLVFAVADRSLHDRHTAEDVFQATFFVLARDAAKIRAPESVGAWLHETAMRISRRARRRRQETALATPEPQAPHVSILDAISDQFEQELVDEELQRLSASYRTPLILHILEGKTCEETARALGTTVGAVRGRLQRGKQELKRRLLKRGIEASAVITAVALSHATAAASVSGPLVSATIQGGIAAAHGGALPPTCSPEVLQLATREIAMHVTGKAFAGTAVIVSLAAAGWWAQMNAQVSLAATDRPPAFVPQAVPPLATTVIAETSDDQRLLTQVSATEAEPAEEKDTKPQLTLKYGDGKPDGKKSIAGTGEMIRFTLPNATQKLRSLRIHCARYGTPQPPDEKATITIVSDDGTDVIHTEHVPYATFKRGESRWTTIKFEQPVKVPETFWVILEFNAERTKGVYISYDTDTAGQHSKTGVPGGTSNEVNFAGDWMVQAILTEPE